MVTQVVKKTALATTGVALISIGMGLIGYAWTLTNLYGRIVLIVVGIAANGLAVVAFITVPASDTSSLANDVRKLQGLESQLAPFLSEYGGDIEKAIEAMVSAAFQKASADLQKSFDDLKASVDKLTKQIEDLANPKPSEPQTVTEPQPPIQPQPPSSQ